MAQTEQAMSLAEVRAATIDHVKIAGLIGVPAENWAGNCHSVSLAILRTGIVGPGRIARGYAKGIVGQHSWIVLGDDCYDPDVIVVDPTYRPALGCPDGEPLILVARAGDLNHIPHGDGSILGAPRPRRHGGPVVGLTPRTPLSEEARDFLNMLGPLDHPGWLELANSPVGDWPAAEILTAMDDSGMGPMIPIDIVGMLTDRNPRGLYR